MGANPNSDPGPPAAKWWLSSGESTEGPFPTEHVAEWLKTGQIRGDAMACREGAQEWKRLDEIPAFGAAIRAFAPSAPPPATTLPVIYCPSCGRPLRVPSLESSARVRCSGCQRVFTTPRTGPQADTTPVGGEERERMSNDIAEQAGAVSRFGAGANRAKSGLLTTAIVLGSVALGVEMVSVPPLDNPAIGVLYLYLCTWVAGLATWLVFHYRLWALIPPEYAETTPGRAVGYLFIPFYNFYWMFQSFVGVARSLNRCAANSGDSHQPRASLGLATAYCVTLVASVFVQLLLNIAISDLIESGDLEAASGLAIFSFVLLSVPRFVLWLLMVLNQKRMVEHLLSMGAPVNPASGFLRR